MKSKTIIKYISIITAVSCLLICGCGSEYSGIDYSDVTINTDNSENAIQNLTLSFNVGSDMASLNPYHTTSLSELSILTNLYDPLTTNAPDGSISPCLATAWEPSADYATWTFHLRDDAMWVDVQGHVMDRIRSNDFVTGLEWVLNYYKGEAYSIQMSTEYVLGAKEYLDYTEGLTEEEALSLTQEDFMSCVGIETPDENTVVYHLTRPCSFFPSVVNNVEFYPTSKIHLDELGVDKFKINSIYDTWFNGPYIMTEYIPDNEKILDANPNWYGNDEHIRFMSITYKAVEGSSVALQLYKNGELDYVELYQSQVRSIINDSDNPYYDYLVKALPSQYMIQIVFNYHKYNDDGTEDENWNKAVANESFRRSWYYGLDLTLELMTLNPILPYECEINTIVPYGLVSLRDGTDYAELVETAQNLPPSDGQTTRRYNEQLFIQSKRQAMEELAQEGVTFPIDVDYHISASDQAALDSALVFKNLVEQFLGTDYVNINILTYISSYHTEVCVPKLQSFATAGWGADFADPSSILAQFKHFDDNAYITTMYSNIDDYSPEDIAQKPYLTDIYDQFEQYNTLYDAANAINDDSDARYNAFAEAEVFLLNHSIVLPYEQESNWVLTKMNLTNCCKSIYSINRHRYVDISTDKNGYTNAIWEAGK